jgi:hypothetical protein
MLSTSLLLATAVFVAAHGVEVRSTTSCPSRTDIAERLRPLLPRGLSDQAAPDVATVDVVEDGHVGEVRIRLLRPDGSEVGNRRFVAQGDCAEAAATVAAVIAAWEIQPDTYRPPFAPSTATRASPSTPPDSAWHLWVGAGGGGGVIGGLAGVGRIETTAGKAESRLRARLGVAAETSRTSSLRSGSVAWSHTAFEASAVARTLHPTWSLSLEVGMLLGWATLEGRQFDHNRVRRSFEYGGVAALRLARALGRWSGWIEVRTQGWVRGQRASLAGESAYVDVPREDVIASMGLSAPIF